MVYRHVINETEKMGKHHLGEFEEIVMLTIAILEDKAYGFAIIEEIENFQRFPIFIVLSLL